MAKRQKAAQEDDYAISKPSAGRRMPHRSRGRTRRWRRAFEAPTRGAPGLCCASGARPRRERATIHPPARAATRTKIIDSSFGFLEAYLSS